MLGCRCERLYRETRQHRPAAITDASVAVPMNPETMPLWQPSHEHLYMASKVPAKDAVTGDGAGPIRIVEPDEVVNILIVDDDPKNLTVLETVLDDPLYRLVRAESADAALLALLVEEF